MMALIGLVILFGVLFSVYNAVRFLFTRNNRYGRRMVYGCAATAFLALLIAFL